MHHVSSPVMIEQGKFGMFSDVKLCLQCSPQAIFGLFLIDVEQSVKIVQIVPIEEFNSSVNILTVQFPSTAMITRKFFTNSARLHPSRQPGLSSSLKSSRF